MVRTEAALGAAGAAVRVSAVVANFACFCQMWGSWVSPVPLVRETDRRRNGQLSNCYRCVGAPSRGSASAEYNSCMDSGTVASLIVASVAAVAAVFAAVFAGLVPTKKDLERVAAETSARVGKVEAHIKSVDERLREQHAREITEAAARRVSISVRGSQEYSEPLQLTFAIKNSDAALASIELLNETETLFGSALCTKAASRTFTASVDDPVARRWFSGGAIEAAESRRVVIRAHILIEGRKAKRDFAVYLKDQLKDTVLGFRGNYLTLEGDC